MIALDTNILVRHLTQDDAQQARRLEKFLGSIGPSDTLHVDDVVLCEVVWVLRSAYRIRKAAIIDTVDKILNTIRFSFEDRELLRLALEDYRDGTGDFSDYVIGRRNLRAGCDRTVTFDRSLAASKAFDCLT